MIVPSGLTGARFVGLEVSSDEEAVLLLEPVFVCLLELEEPLRLEVLDKLSFVWPMPLVPKLPPPIVGRLKGSKTKGFSLLDEPLCEDERLLDEAEPLAPEVTAAISLPEAPLRRPLELPWALDDPLKVMPPASLEELELVAVEANPLDAPLLSL